MSVERPSAAELVAWITSDPEALAHLRGVLGPEGAAPVPAYTVATLAATLGVSERVVRNAIARGELPAVKHGARWYIAADAVDVWTHDARDVSWKTRRFARDRQPLAATFAQMDHGAQRRA